MTRVGGATGEAEIPQYSSDPSDPAAEDAWVLETASVVKGGSVGILLAITYPAGVSSYQLSYRTQDGTTVRADLV